MGTLWVCGPPPRFEERLVPWKRRVSPAANRGVRELLWEAFVPRVRPGAPYGGAAYLVHEPEWVLLNIPPRRVWFLCRSVHKYVPYTSSLMYRIIVMLLAVRTGS